MVVVKYCQQCIAKSSINFFLRGEGSAIENNVVGQIKHLFCDYLEHF
jgi:hypothetical protein